MILSFSAVITYISIYIGLVATSFYVLSFIEDSRKKKLLYKDNELPSLSVIIPAYNEEESIELTISSILKSDYPKDKFEIIVVDDGSKDKTYEIAKRFKKNLVRVFTKKNNGKGSALNFAIKKAKGEIIITMDADTTADNKSAKEMVRFFKDPKVAAVTPAMVTIKPENIWQRIQYIEYITGLFLRKAFASVNANYITPGAFSAYRKSFFEKHGGYDEDNLTEDLELALRIHYYNYVIENCPDAPVYTNPPKKFIHLLKQRRRWYVGLLKNVWKYKKILSKEYGDLGIFVLPIAWLSILFSIFMVIYNIFNIFINVNKEFLFYRSINFDIYNTLDFSSFIFQRIIFRLLTNTILWFVIIFIIALGFYLYFAKKKIGKIYGLYSNLILFFVLFALLFGFWWLISLFYIAFNRKISWK